MATLLRLPTACLPAEPQTTDGGTARCEAADERHAPRLAYMQMSARHMQRVPGCP
jgi:hypothetical protein